MSADWQMGSPVTRSCRHIQLGAFSRRGASPKRLAARGGSICSTPLVSGGVLRAREGALAVMVGGKPEVYARCREILQSFGDGIFYVGEHGSGHLVKA